MDAAGAWIGPDRRLYVEVADLVAHEARLRAERRAAQPTAGRRPGARASGNGSKAQKPATAPDPVPLSPDWWEKP
jgi:hypothetical protein